jgi:hypothetical protein
VGELNYKAIIFYVIVLVAVVLAVSYFFNLFHFKETVTRITSTLALPSLPNFDLNGIFKWIQENTVVSGIVASLGTVAVGAVIKSIQTNSLLNKTTAALAETKGQVASATAQATAYKEKLGMYEGDTTAFDLQKSIDGMKTEYNTLLSTKEGIIESLTKQNQELATKLTAIPYRTVEVVK